MKKLLLFPVVSAIALTGTSEDVIFRGARIDQSVIDSKDQWFKPYFGWADARGYTVWSPAAAKLSEGYGYLTLPASWDDAAISSEKSYIVKNNLSVPCAPSGGTMTFDGKRIAFGEYSETDNHTSNSFDSDTKMGWLTPGSGTVTFANEGAFFVNGGMYNEGLFNPTFAGKITVQSPESNPFWFYAYSWSNPTFTFNAEIAGAAGTAMRASIASGSNYITYRFNGDMSNYHGRLNLGKGARVYFGNSATNMPGTLRLAGNATLQPAGASNTGDMRFGALEFTANDSVINLGVTKTANASLRVDNAVSVPEGETARVDYTLPASQLAFDGDNWRMRVTNEVYRTFSLVDIPASIPSIASVFNLVNTSTYNNYNSDYAKLIVMTCEERVDGDRRRFDVIIPKCTYQKVNADSGPSPFSAGSGDKWQNRTASDPIDSETAYYIPSDTSSAFPKEDYVCPAARVVLAQSTYLRQYCDLTINGGLVLTANSTYMLPVSNQGRASISLSGNLTFPRLPAWDGYAEASYYGRPAEFRGERIVDIRANIHGDGVVSFKNLQNSWGFAKSNVEYVLSGDNSDFNGRMVVGHEHGGEGYETNIKIGRSENLGGKTVPKLAYKAIEIGTGGRITATNSLDFSVATHGVYINYRGGIGVANRADTFKIGTQLTMDGELVKSGAGTLALKGALRFTSAESETPVSGKNILTVSEGAVRGMTTNSVNGLAVKFASGSAIGVASPLETISDAERDFGFYNVAGTFDLAGSNGSLNVRVDEAGRYAANGTDLWPDEFSRALCTVSNSTAAGLRGKIRLIGKPSRFAMTVVAVPNADGETTTFRGDFFRSGFVFTFR